MTSTPIRNRLVELNGLFGRLFPLRGAVCFSLFNYFFELRVSITWVANHHRDPLSDRAGFGDDTHNRGETGQ